MTTIDPYSDPWPNDNQALIEAFTASMDKQPNTIEQASEAFEWAMGAVVNQRDSVFLCAVEQCAIDKLKNIFEEACREKYIFAALHLVDKLPTDTVTSVELSAQTGSLELLEKVLEGMDITKEVSDNIIIGALKGDCLNIVQRYYPNGFGEQYRAFVRFAARYNAIDCLRHYVTEPVPSQEWDYCIEFAIKDWGAQAIAFFLDNPPTNPKYKLTSEQYAINIAERLIGERLPQRNSRPFECLRVCMRYLTWENLVADLGHRSDFQKHTAELCDLYQEPYTEQLKEHMEEHVGKENNVQSRKI